jgi:predicted nuclease with TOPRIM domain
MPCTYRRAALLSIKDKTKYGNTINKKYAGRKGITPFLLTKQGQDIGACLEFLKTKLTRKDIKEELLVAGVIDLSKINDYVDIVLRTREELNIYIIKYGDDTTKKKAGLL